VQGAKVEDASNYTVSLQMANWQMGLAIGLILLLIPVVYALAILLVHSFVEVSNMLGNGGVLTSSAVFSIIVLLAAFAGFVLLVHFRDSVKQTASGWWLQKVYYPQLHARAIRLREFAKSPAADDRCQQPFYSMRHAEPYKTTVDLSRTNSNVEDGNNEDTSVGERRLLQHKQRKLLSKLEELFGEVGLMDRVPLKAARGALFNSTADQILAAPLKKLFGGIHVQFQSCLNGPVEPGLDSGGLTVEWFNLVGQELIQKLDTGASAVLMRANSVPGSSLPMFKALPDATLVLTSAGRLPMYYFALGRIAAMAVIYNCRGENCVMDLSLASAVRKFIVDKEVAANDVRVVDPIFYKNRMELILQPDGVEMMKMILCEDDIFFVYTDAEGEEGPELMPGGKSVKVTKENKSDYVALLAEFYLCGETREEIANFLRGFWDLVPLQLLQQCEIDEKDIALLISGVPEIDVQDWRNGCDVPSSADAQVVSWLWQVLEELPMEDRARCLQFATGLSRLPAGGFDGLSPRFKVHILAGRNPTSLPTAHTCFNTLELAPYESKEALRKALGIAITEGLTGFELM